MNHFTTKRLILNIICFFCFAVVQAQEVKSITIAYYDDGLLETLIAVTPQAFEQDHDLKDSVIIRDKHKIRMLINALDKLNVSSFRSTTFDCWSKLKIEYVDATCAKTYYFTNTQDRAYCNGKYYEMSMELLYWLYKFTHSYRFRRGRC